jgi:hypothetical protein
MVIAPLRRYRTRSLQLVPIISTAHDRRKR